MRLWVYEDPEAGYLWDDLVIGVVEIPRSDPIVAYVSRQYLKGMLNPNSRRVWRVVELRMIH